MACFVCVTCGVQHEESGGRPPARCRVCEDERQYVPTTGQQWTTVEELARTHHNQFRRYEDGLVGIGTLPSFAIGQRALLVQSPSGNVLWDCVTLLDEFTRRAIEHLGGLACIAISHPHFYAALADWAAAFDVPVYLHACDRQWVMRPVPSVMFWEGDQFELHDGLRLVNAGGHFDGGTVLHAPGLAGGRGALLTGDIIQVIPDRNFVAFMYSYPNLIPLPVPAVRRIAESVRPLPFERIYGAWWDRVIPGNAKAVVERSAERYERRVANGKG
jgi:hypothetical protein